MAESSLQNNKLQFTNTESNVGEVSFTTDEQFESNRAWKFTQGLITSSLEVGSSTGFTVNTTYDELSSKIYYLNDDSSNELKLTVPTTITDYTLTFPSAQGSSDTFLKNDGSGNLSFSNEFNVLKSKTCALLDDSTNQINLKAPSSSTTHTLTLPSTQGASNSYLKNDGSGNLSWSTVSSDIPKLVYALQGALVDYTTPSDGSLFAIHSCQSVTSGNYVISKEELDPESMMSSGTFTVPSGKTGWYRIHGMFFHPNSNISGSNGQNGLGEFRIALQFSTQNYHVHSIIDATSGMPDTSTINIVRYLQAGSTFSFRYNGANNNANEDFLISISVVRYS